MVTDRGGGERIPMSWISIVFGGRGFGLRVLWIDKEKACQTSPHTQTPRKDRKNESSPFFNVCHPQMETNKKEGRGG